MKYLVRVLLFNIFALWLTSQILPTLSIAQGWQSMVFAGFILSFLMLIIAPILKILFIPINIITFGLLSWIVNVIVLYLLTVFVPEIQIQDWIFSGIFWAGFVIPGAHISYTPALIITSLVLTAITDVLHSVSEN